MNILLSTNRFGHLQAAAAGECQSKPRGNYSEVGGPANANSGSRPRPILGHKRIEMQVNDRGFRPNWQNRVGQNREIPRANVGGVRARFLHLRARKILLAIGHELWQTRRVEKCIAARKSPATFWPPSLAIFPEFCGVFLP